MSILLKNCNILKTENDDFVEIKNGYLGIDGDTIDYISDVRPEKKYDEEKDMSGKLLMPGLVNAHGHTAMTLLRGKGSDLNLQDWLHQEMFPVEDKMVNEDFYAGRAVAILEMISTGTTTFSDMYMDPVGAIELCGKAGLRGHFSSVFQSFNPDETYEENGRGPRNNEIFEKYNNSFNGRIRVDYMVHAEYTTFKPITKKYVEDAKKRGATFHTHISETKKEHDECLAKYNQTPTEWFEEIGAFENPSYLAHCVWASEHDLEIFKKYNLTCVHHPSSNMKLGSGFAPIQKMLDMGINVALGTDGAASNNNLDLFEEMHIASIIHNGNSLDPTILKAKDVLKIATINGAKALQRFDTGSLEVGKKADIIALDLHKPHLHPNLDTVSLIVYSAQGSDVCMNMVDGKIIYENGKFLTLDEDEIYRLVDESVKRLYQ